MIEPPPAASPDEPRPERRRPRGRLRLRRLVGWGVVTVLAILTGALAFAYTHVTDSETLIALINRELPEFLPDSTLQANRVQLKPFLGQVDLRNVRLYQRVDGLPFRVVEVPWLQVRCDLQKLWKGELEPREIILAQPTLRLRRREDGSWNLEGLLADPWPATPQLRPTVRIHRGSIVLVDGPQPGILLHNAELTCEPTEAQGVFRFSGSAQGDGFEKLALAGLLDTIRGRVELTRGDLAGLSLNETLRQRLPAEWQAAWARIGLAGGEVDLGVDRLACDREGAGMSHALRIDLRAAAWSSPELPFPLSKVSASARLEDGLLTVDGLDGDYGKTHVRVEHARIDAADPLDGPMELEATVSELDLDAALRGRLPPDWQVLWDDFAPEGRDSLGRVSLSIRAGRERAGAPPAFRVGARLLGVAMNYRLFPFPLEQVHGHLTWSGDRMDVHELHAFVGGKPLTARGVIHDPGPRARVELDFAAGAIPIDEAGPFVEALPPEFRDLVTEFRPTGSVRGTAKLRRSPGTDPADELGDVRVEADLELNEGCSIRWAGLPYPVQRLTGRLLVRPDHCIFSDMRGENGEARIAAWGRVDALGPGRFASDVKLEATRLRFDSPLRDALPPEWKATWELLNPSGYCRLEARVVAGQPDPARPDRTLLKLAVGPEDEASVRLRMTPAPGTPGIGPGRQIELPRMRDVRGTFVFDNGDVTMRDVEFVFGGAPAKVRGGRVRLQPDGAFDLRVQELEVSRMRLDSELRQIMPPLLADFAAKIDDGRPFQAGGDLAIAWSGRPEDPAVCGWENGRVYLHDNSFSAGVPLEHIHGQLAHIRGRSDGRSLEFTGVAELDSFVVAGQQVTNFASPIRVGGGRAVLESIRAELLGGVVEGRAETTLDVTPDYAASFRLIGADLARYTQTLPGRQDLAGRVDGWVELGGSGADLRRLGGRGAVRLTDGDLGRLPFFLKLLQPVPLSGGKGPRPAFDRADLAFLLKDGEATLGPIKITGDTISLHGQGRLDFHGEIDLTFIPVYGRDERLHVPGLSDATREAGGKLLELRARGPLTDPRITPVFVPGVLDIFTRRPAERREAAAARERRAILPKR